METMSVGRRAPKKDVVLRAQTVVNIVRRELGSAVTAGDVSDLKWKMQPSRGCGQDEKMYPIKGTLCSDPNCCRCDREGIRTVFTNLCDLFMAWGCTIYLTRCAVMYVCVCACVTVCVCVCMCLYYPFELVLLVVSRSVCVASMVERVH